MEGVWVTRIERVERVKGDGRHLHPHPHQVGQKIPSSGNVRKKEAITYVYTLAVKPTKSKYSLRRLTYPTSKPEAEMENAGVLLPL